MPRLKLPRAIRGLIPNGWHPYERAQAKIVRESKGVVMSGPFQGMRYLNDPADFLDYSMLLGTYERELHPIIASLASSGLRTIIDVGAAQGFYVVGLARNCPDARIVAFESNPEGVEQLHRMARANGVDGRIETRGFCSPEALAEAIHEPSKTLVIMDIDGGEKDLLDPALVPALGRCTILLEEHDFLVPGIIDLIHQRFASTHAIERIEQETRTKSDLPMRSAVLDRWLVATMNERPPGNSWLYLKPVH
jgi:predicted O-methyltransferase YrrM